MAERVAVNDDVGGSSPPVPAKMSEAQVKKAKRFEALFVQVPITDAERDFPDPDYGL
jgi:hypothetical protein